MKPELLSPAGNKESLIAAVSAGCDAVYLGGKMFGARAFSNNFNDEELIEAIKYAHLYGVKVYVTINTLIYEREVDTFMKYVDFLYKNNVDALIIQDIGMMDLIRKTYPLLELHASTQMHIHNIEGVKLVERLGLKRAVLARETDIDTIKYIKENTNTELEIFVHGALCISYSGQCLMSSLIGNRSGNRGSCTGCCRLKYNLESNGKKLNKENYLLSTKDLCSLEHIGKLIDIGVDSFKIEGRMKSPEYVYMVTKIYRKAIDSYIKNKTVEIDLNELNDLKKIFNREYTKGFLFKANNDEITNEFRPNHLGVEIGKVINYKNNMVDIKLNSDLNLQDGIRILDNDIGFTVINMYKNHKKVSCGTKGDIISIPLKDRVNINSKVVKTTDYLLNKKVNELIKNNKKIDVDVYIEAYKSKPFVLKMTDGKNNVEIIGNTVEKSINSPITKEKIQEQISKLGNTIYKINNININCDDDIFIFIKDLNEYRRTAVDKLNNERLYNYEYFKQEYKIDLPDFDKQENYNVYLSTVEQYNKIKDKNIHSIYLDEDLYNKIADERKVLKLERVINNHIDYDIPLLVGELGSLKYKDIVTDWSFNVTNSYSVAFLHSTNVKKVTLSYELTDTQIEQIITNYKKRYNKHPNLELIIYGKEEAMICKFNLNKLYNVDKSYLIDRFNNKYLVLTKNNLMKIYNYKTRNLNNHKKYFELGINNLRYNLLDEEKLPF